MLWAPSVPVVLPFEHRINIPMIGNKPVEARPPATRAFSAKEGCGLSLLHSLCKIGEVLFKASVANGLVNPRPALAQPFGRECPHAGQRKVVLLIYFEKNFPAFAKASADKPASIKVQAGGHAFTKSQTSKRRRASRRFSDERWLGSRSFSDEYGLASRRFSDERWLASRSFSEGWCVFIICISIYISINTYTLRLNVPLGVSEKAVRAVIAGNKVYRFLSLRRLSVPFGVSLRVSLHVSGRVVSFVIADNKVSRFLYHRVYRFAYHPHDH